MNIPSNNSIESIALNSHSNAQVARGKDLVNQTPHETSKQDPLREAFHSFVGQTFYGQMLQAMRNSVGKPAYFHGGRAEEVFQKQLDQIISERLSQANGGEFADGLYEQQFPPAQWR